MGSLPKKKKREKGEEKEGDSESQRERGMKTINLSKKKNQQ